MHLLLVTIYFPYKRAFLNQNKSDINEHLDGYNTILRIAYNENKVQLWKCNFLCTVYPTLFISVLLLSC